jgi:hypothetical protein
MKLLKNNTYVLLYESTDWFYNFTFAPGWENVNFPNIRIFWRVIFLSIYIEYIAVIITNADKDGDYFDKILLNYLVC